MGSVSDQQGVGAGDWKGGHMRIESNEHEPTGSSDSGKGDIELRDPKKTQGASADQQPYSDALNEEDRSSGEEAVGDGTYQFYKVYKRRWFGLVQLTLLNIVVSWDVSIPSFSLSVPLFLPFFFMGPCEVLWYHHGRAFSSTAASDQNTAPKPLFCVGLRANNRIVGIQQHGHLQTSNENDCWYQMTTRLIEYLFAVVNLLPSGFQCCIILQHQ